MRRTRTSKTIEISRRRLEKLNSIKPTPDLGTRFSISDFAAKIEEGAESEASYNTSLSDSDSKLTVLKVKEKELREMREHMLTAIAFIYGKDSEQYVAAGGIRKSERKRPRPRNASSTTGSENGMSN